MIGKQEDSIQAIQTLLRRTHKGRLIRDEVMNSVKEWQSKIGTEYGKSECQNCGLILKSNYFVDGCINCGCTDVSDL